MTRNISATEQDVPLNKSPDNSADFRTIISNKTPLMEVRAPIEFEKGAFNHSINLPLMNDDERAAVGLCYKKMAKRAPSLWVMSWLQDRVKQDDWYNGKTLRGKILKVIYTVFAAVYVQKRFSTG